MFDILDVAPRHLPQLMSGLQALAKNLNDPFEVSEATLSDGLFGPFPSCAAALAIGPEDTLGGAVLFSPVMSTSLGGAGAYVSDLWVAQPARNQSLGPRLLHHVAHRGARLWQARFIRLVSYDNNHRARAFYARNGFADHSDERVLTLQGKELDALLARYERPKDG